MIVSLPVDENYHLHYWFVNEISLAVVADERGGRETYG
jgi:hypothetical protein